jgi:hypothetical protein
VRLLGNETKLKEQYEVALDRAREKCQMIGGIPDDLTEEQIAQHQSSAIETGGKGYAKARIESSHVPATIIAKTLANLSEDWDESGSVINGHQPLGQFQGTDHSANVRIINNYETRSSECKDRLLSRYPALALFEKEARDVFAARTAGEDCVIESVNAFVQTNHNDAGAYQLHIDGHHENLLLTSVFFLGEIDGRGGKPKSRRRGEPPFGFYQYGMGQILDFAEPGDTVHLDARSYHSSVLPDEKRYSE